MPRPPARVTTSCMGESIPSSDTVLKTKVEYPSCASNQHTTTALLLYHVISTLPSELPESILMGEENDSPRLFEKATFTLGSP